MANRLYFINYFAIFVDIRMENGNIAENLTKGAR
jgi:hypothetical protein